MAARRVSYAELDELKARNPCDAPGAGGGGGDQNGGANGLDRELARYRQTDLGNAKRFCARFRGRMRYCETIGWISWDGKRWAAKGAQAAVLRAEHETVIAIRREAAAVRGTGDDFEVERDRKDKPVMLSDKLESWARSSESASKLNAISRHAIADLSIDHSELDADRFTINCNNGTLIVRRNGDQDPISFKPHDPSDLITKLAPVDYDPAATCPTYDAFLAQVHPSESARRFLHQWFGLSLTGDTTNQKFLFNYGGGNNGKSTLLDTVAYIAGDYATTMPIETFLDNGKPRGAGQASPDLAMLPGVRLVRTSEPEPRAKLAEAFVKQITGGEGVLARDLNSKYFEFLPQLKLTISGNNKPDIRGVDFGIWRRVILLPWDVTVSGKDLDKRLGDKLKAEASGILNRLIDGLRDYLEHGLIAPQEALEATAEYRAESDPIGRFLEDCTDKDPAARVQTSALYELFKAWARANAERESFQQYFGRVLRQHGLRSIKSHGVHWWLGIRATRTIDDFLDHEGRPLKFGDGASSSEPESKGDDEFTI